MTASPIPRAGNDAPRRDARIVAIASGKGGVGKTWLSITLAQTLSRLGKRALLFDGDLGLANADIQLGLTPDRDLQTVLAGRIALKDAILRHEDGAFDIIAGRSGSGALAGLPADRLDGLANRLINVAPHYHRVFIDLGAGIEKTVRRLAQPAATILVVTTTEPTSLTDAYAFIKLMLRDDPGADVRIVVNMAPSTGAGEHTYMTLSKACQSFLKIKPALAGVVRRDDKVPDAIRHQVPLLTRFPNCHAASDVEAIVKRLMKSP